MSTSSAPISSQVSRRERAPATARTGTPPAASTMIGNPVPGIERRLGPFQHEHPGPWSPLHPSSHPGHPGSQTRHQHVRASGGARGGPDGADAVDDLVEPARVQGDHLGVTPEDIERLLHGPRWHRADLAQVLGQDQVGLDGPELRVVKCVDGLTRSDPCADRGIDLLRAQRTIRGRVPSPRRPAPIVRAPGSRTRS